MAYVHGDSRRTGEAPEHRSWRAMIDRCENRNNNHFANTRWHRRIGSNAPNAPGCGV